MNKVITVTKYIKMLKAALTHVPTVTGFISRYHTYNNNNSKCPDSGLRNIPFMMPELPRRRPGTPRPNLEIQLKQNLLIVVKPAISREVNEVAKALSKS